MKTQKENLEFLEIPELGIRVAKEISGEMTLIEAEEYCQKNKARLLTVAEAGYIYDNNLIPSFCSGREWLEHYSKKMRQKGFGFFAFLRNWIDGSRLYVSGSYLVDINYGHAFGVRLVFQISDKARSQ